MGSRKAFYNQEYGKHVGAVIMFIASFVALLFTTVGTPLGMLMVRSPASVASIAVVGSNACFTLWGLHGDCNQPDYPGRITSPTIFNCRPMHVRFEVAEAFSVLSIFTVLFVCGASWYKICGSHIKRAIILLSIFSIACVLVPWAIVTSFYYTSFCGLKFLTREEARLGPGYALLITSFVVQIVSLILFIFLEPETIATTSDEDDRAPISDASSNAALK
ncbi:hypothetical protein JKF63_02886 [Porcisia hertigi]|uniref:Amastin-like surface protein-like protein n=1 Tax=Porcisia hertigi TaxID=2761500 RepID=A0A836I854_9TRYP|nr:hypothetical protein JKF63_02886 [Porcisia hertigi]